MEQITSDSEYFRVPRKMAQDTTMSLKAKGVLLYMLSVESDQGLEQSKLREGLGVGDEEFKFSMNELLEKKCVIRTREILKGVFQPYTYKLNYV